VNSLEVWYRRKSEIKECVGIMRCKRSLVAIRCAVKNAEDADKQVENVKAVEKKSAFHFALLRLKRHSLKRQHCQDPLLWAESLLDHMCVVYDV
jgi:hypothetical protein